MRTRTGERPDTSRMLSASISASGTSEGSRTPASCTMCTPSAKARASRGTACSTSLVLPTPPVPVRLTSRWAATRRLTSAVS